MNKLAIFVEGQTEQIFAEKLLVEIAGKGNVRIEKRASRGGGKGKRSMRLIEASVADSAQKYFVLIVDCGEDDRVQSDIRERYDSLVATGYKAIIGLRDVYPQKREGIPKLRRGLKYKLKTASIQVLSVLAVMEIEAWFIAEHTHFARISEQLTMELIKASVGFDPSSDDAQFRDHPAQDLHNIYGLAGCAYNKSKTNVQRTVDVLDYARVYLELGENVSDLQTLVDHIDGFLSKTQAG